MPDKNVRLLLLYSTVDGQTLKICERLSVLFRDHGSEVTLREVSDISGSDLGCFDFVVVGASIRYGFHRRNVRTFMRQNQAALQDRKCAFFSVNLVARKPSRAGADTNPYLRHFLHSIGWKPVCVQVFAGRLDYPRCTPVDRFLIRLIMWMTGGPTDPDTVVEYTDWTRVEAWGRHLLTVFDVPEAGSRSV